MGWVGWRAVVLLGALSTSWAGSASPLKVSSVDGSVTVGVDPATGELVTLAAGTDSKAYSVTGGTSILGGDVVSASARAIEGGAVLVSKLLCMPGGDVPCSVTEQVVIQELFSPRPTSVGWTVNASSKATDPPAPLWEGVVVTSVHFANVGDKKFWAPWDRNNGDIDPLNPSDGHFGWWTGEYLLGAQVVKAPDHVVHEQATVLHPAQNTGLSFIPNPRNPPAHPTWLNISGPTAEDGDCRLPNTCTGPGAFTVSRHRLRFGQGASPHVFDTDVVAHEACWRSALGWSAKQHAAFWEPTVDRIKKIEGLGSYSSFLGSLSDPKYAEMGYALNWDLSGRFFPYAGQFLPPVQRGEVWLNDGEGTQQRANVSFEVIDGYYNRIQKEGFSTLSYFNVFEFGENICGTGIPGRPLPCKSSGVPNNGVPPSSAAAWANSTWFLLQNFPKSLVTNYDCGAHGGCPATQPGQRRVIGTWQGGVVVDPADPLLKAHFISQLERKYAEIDHFEGIVVDRSDWNSVYNFDFDDGASIVGNRTCHLAQYSYIDTIRALRSTMSQRENSSRFNQTVMLINAVGFAQLSLNEYFDGSFSEGSAVNAVGILGARSTAILWTANSNECCKTPALADNYFQRRLYMKVFPMAPFPMADHCIGPSPTAEELYKQYGKLFTALRGSKWLLRAHAVNVSGGSAVANVFETSNAPGYATLWVVALGGNNTVASLSVAYLPPNTDTKSFEILHPAGSWMALPNSAVRRSTSADRAVLAVPLIRGCALVRLRSST